MAATVPKTIIARDPTNRFICAYVRDAASASIGVIRGATSMAPITTAAEFAIKPNAAIVVERRISVANRFV